MRDSQRSLCYAWERACTKGTLFEAAFATNEDCADFLAPIWRAERGRYGRPKVPTPRFERPVGGARRGMAYAGWHVIRLPRATRNPWYILHEAAHLLTPRDEAHGPRFVGVLIGLAARHLGYDAYELMARADEMGLKYRIQSIGTVPVHGPAWHVERAIREEGPMPEMELACWCDLTYLQVRGAALSLIRQGRARWFRKKLHYIPPTVAANDDVEDHRRAGACLKAA